MDLDRVIELSLETKNSEYLKAADDGELKTLVLLLNAGANIKCMDEDGYSALHLAARKGHDTMVKMLVDRGLDVNTRGYEDRTPLMLAARAGQESTVNTLISAGADLTCKV